MESRCQQPSLWNDDSEESSSAPCCRVCHGEGEEQRPLYHPCKCDGSIKFVHQDCLQEWVRISRQREPKCELCGEKIQFRNVYAPDAPVHLSFIEFCNGLFPRFLQHGQAIFQGASLFLCWLVLLPIFTSWWLDICTAIVLNNDLPLSIKNSLKISCWWNGVIVSAAILVVCAGVSQVIATIAEELNMANQNHNPRAPVAETIHDRQEQDTLQERVEDFVTNVRDRRAEDIPSGTAENESGVPIEGSLVVRPDTHNFAAVNAHHGLSNTEGEEDGREGEELRWVVDQDTMESNQNERSSDRDVNRPANEGIAGGEDRPLPHINQPENVLELNLPVEGAAPGPEMVFDGPTELTIRRFIVICIFNAAVILLVEVVPVMVGRLVLGLAGNPSWLLSWTQAMRISLQENRDAVYELGLSEDILLRRVHALLEGSFGAFVLLQIGTCAVVSYLLWNYDQQIVPLVRSLYHQCRALGQSLKKWVKLSLIFTIEGCVLPQLLGWLIDIVTIMAFDTSLTERILLCRKQPVLCGIAHWFVGFLFMLHVAVIALELRDVVKRDLLIGILPETPTMVDMDESIFDALAAKTVSELLRRFLLNTCFYVPGVLVSFLIPFRLGHYLCPISRPLQIKFDELVVDVQLPLELLVFHVLVPFMLERVRHRTVVRTVVRMFMLRACEMLQLTEAVIDPSVRDVPEPTMLVNNEGLGRVGDGEGVGVRGEGVVGGVRQAEGGREGGGESGPEGEGSELTAVHGADVESEEVKREEEDVDEEEGQTWHWTDPLTSSTSSLEEEVLSPVTDESVEPADSRAKAQSVSPCLSTSPPTAVEPPSTVPVNRDGEGSRLAEEQRRVVRNGAVLVALGLAFAALTYSWMIHLPLAVGRRALATFTKAPDYDLYNMCAGVMVLWATSIAGRYILKDVAVHNNVVSILGVLGKWMVIGVKVLVLGSIWLVVIPLMIGVIFESVAVIPLRVAAQETPVYPLMQCWALGLVFLKIWMRCVMLGAFGDIEWKRRFDRVYERGLANLDALFVFQNILIPILLYLTDFLIFPYVLSRTVIRVLAISDYTVQTRVARYSFCAFLTVRFLWWWVLYVGDGLRRLHAEIRDSRYLLGTELANR